ncbi:hypothetical protein HU200_002470 [Digitaria exilis]|uniref:Uncharacterized protein n=1 Tax=Digitaria exilis TaxID=1010633 RepID=A0A835KZ77_9POAL|nr:hypothetical protein HU200_002470 [Digitaria exilis]
MAGGFGDEEEGGAGGGVVHHVWYIRTVGLDEATIASIAAVSTAAGWAVAGTARCASASSPTGSWSASSRAAHTRSTRLASTPGSVPTSTARSAAPLSSSFPPISPPLLRRLRQTVSNWKSIKCLTKCRYLNLNLRLRAPRTLRPLQIHKLRTQLLQGEENGGATPKPIRRSASMDSPLFLATVPEARDVVARSNCKLLIAREMKIFRVKEKEAAGTSSSSCQSGRFKIGRSMSSSGQGFFSRNGRTSGTVMPL